MMMMMIQVVSSSPTASAATGSAATCARQVALQYRPTHPRAQPGLRPPKCRGLAWPRRGLSGLASPGQVVGPHHLP